MARDTSTCWTLEPMVLASEHFLGQEIQCPAYGVVTGQSSRNWTKWASIRVTSSECQMLGKKATSRTKSRGSSERSVTPASLACVAACDLRDAG